MDNIKLGKNVRLGKNVVLTGDVEIGDDTSVWHNVVIRGDVEPVKIGKRCNIQDNSVLHGQLGQYDVVLGDDVSIGHSCIIHGCHLADRSFAGMGTIIMNGVKIGEQVFVAAGSLVTERSIFEESNTLVIGRPAKKARSLREKEIFILTETPKRYLEYAKKWLPSAN